MPELQNVKKKKGKKARYIQVEPILLTSILETGKSLIITFMCPPGGFQL